MNRNTSQLPRNVADVNIKTNLQFLLGKIEGLGRGQAPVANVLDYVRGDGTDETEKLQRAIHENSALYFPLPPVFYGISDTLTYFPNHLFFGQRGAEIRSLAALAAPMLAPSNADPHDGVRIMGLTLDNDDAAEVGGVGIEINGANVLLEHVGFKNLETGIDTTNGVLLIAPVWDAVTTMIIGAGAVDAVVLGDDGQIQAKEGAADALSLVLGLAREVGFYLHDVDQAGFIGRLLFENGSAGDPPISFLSDPAIGLFRAASGVLGLAGNIQHEGVQLGLYGLPPAAQQAAPSVPADFTGLADGEAGTPYASVDDVNALKGVVADLIVALQTGTFVS